MVPGRMARLAMQLRGKVKPCECYNPNLGEVAYHSLLARLRGYRVEALLGKSLVALVASGFDSEISFSLNAPDRICLLDKRLRPAPADIPHPVYVSASDSRTTAAWLRMTENGRFLSAFCLSSRESIQVYRNAVSMIGSPDRATESTLGRLCDLADRVRVPAQDGVVDGVPFDVDRMPRVFASLRGWIRRFAIGDDHIRGEVLAGVSAMERALMRTQVEPLLPQIDAFLDSFGDQPLSNEAILLGRLAEAVTEMR